MNRSDEYLIFYFKDDKEQLFNVFYQKYFKLINKIINDLNIQISGFEKKDLYQIGYISLLNALENYKSEQGKFITFLTSCIKNNIYKVLRNNYFLICEQVEAVSNDLFCPQNYVNFYELQTLIDKIIANFKLEYKRIWQLYSQGFTYLQIANQLNISRKKVDNTIRRIKQMMLIQINKRFH